MAWIEPVTTPIFLPDRSLSFVSPPEPISPFFSAPHPAKANRIVMSAIIRHIHFLKFMIASPFFCFSRYDKHYAAVRLSALLRHILYTRMCEIHQTDRKNKGCSIHNGKESCPFPTMDKYPFPIRSDIHPVYTFFRSKLSASFARIIKVLL